MDSFIEKILEQGVIVAFLVWLVWYLTPFVDRWVKYNASQIDSKFNDSRRIDEDLRERFHELDKKVEMLISAVETIQIILKIQPDRREHDRREELD